jgi:nucleoside-diphosphate-sugar epimerase
MKHTIFAATGGVGRRLLEQAIAVGHDVAAVARNPGKRTRQVRTVTAGLAAAADPAALEPAVGSPPRIDGGDAIDEPVAHWIAAQTLECRGDYPCAAAGAVVFAHALQAGGAGSALPCGVFDPEDNLLSLDVLAPALRQRGIAAVNQPVTASSPQSTPAPEGLNP